MKKAFLLSLVMHLLIITGCFLTLQNIVMRENLSIHKIKSIAAYFYEAKSAVEKEKIKPITTPQTLSTTAVATPIQQKIISKQTQKITPLSTSSTNSGEKETPAQLVTILHYTIQNAVTAKINFPLPGKTKSVRVAFVLFPDGHLENIEIIEPDKLALFNELVLDTIKNLPHISAAKNFLKQQQRFTVTIKY